MGKWKSAPEFGFDKPSEALSFCTDSRGVIHAVVRNGLELRHHMRGSKNPFPWEPEGRVIPGDYVGSGRIDVWRDGNLQVIWPKTNGKNQPHYEDPLAFPDPSEPDPMPAPDPKEPFVGGSYYQMQIEPPENIREFIERLKEHGGNATEIFLNFNWPLAKKTPWKSYPTSGWKFSPYKIVGDWSEPKFGDYKFPTFDLDTWNPETWASLQLIMEECKKNGIALFIRIGDYCSIKSPFYKRHYPYNDGSNIQNYTGGQWGKPIRQWYKKFNKKLMRTIAKAGLKHYFIVPMNEADVIGNDSDEWKDKACREFHEFYISDFMAKGVKKEQIILNIHRPNVASHFESLGYRMEWHWVQSPETLRGRFNLSGTHIFPNGDGRGGGEGIASYNGNREPSRSQGVKMGRQLKDKFGYCYFMRSTEPRKGGESVRLANFTALDGIVEGLNNPLPPPPPPPQDKKLEIINGKLHYGDIDRFCGCSRLEALWRALRIGGMNEGWGDHYSQEQYEQDLISSGMNYVRHLGVKDTQFLYDHCKRMRDAKNGPIIVEIGVYRESEEPEGILVNLEDMGDLAKLGNVFFGFNEFVNQDNIAKVIDISDNLIDQGCLVSAGAWSGLNGKALSSTFHSQYSRHQIEAHHREWDDFVKSLSWGKPVSFNEFFSQGNKTLQEIKDIFKTSVDLGIATNYYGYRWPGIPYLSTYDPFDKDAIPKYAGELLNR